MHELLEFQKGRCFSFGVPCPIYFILNFAFFGYMIT